MTSEMTILARVNKRKLRNFCIIKKCNFVKLYSYIHSEKILQNINNFFKIFSYFNQGQCILHPNLGAWDD